MNKITIIVPIILVLATINELGKSYEEYVVGGTHITTAIVLFFGIWLLGYISGKLED